MHYKGIPIGIAYKSKIDSLTWYASTLKPIQDSFDNMQELQNEVPDAYDLCLEELKENKTGVVFICLSTLTTVSNVISLKPQLCSRVRKILWYNDLSAPNLNYETLDKYSLKHTYEAAIETHKIQPDDDAYYDIKLLEKLKKMPALLPAWYCSSIKIDTSSKEEVRIPLKEELVAIYMQNEFAFGSTKNTILLNMSGGNKGSREKNTVNYVTTKSINRNKLVQVLLQNLNPAYLMSSHVFNAIPLESDYYKSDIAAIKDSAILKYGYEEWKSIIFTNELHGNLNIYDVVGAKMGMRIRQYFAIGKENINIISFAGQHLPLSSLNDGLQISTGATLGNGSIIISDSSTVYPSCIAEVNGTKIIVTLNSKYKKLIDKELDLLFQNYSSSSPNYWKYMRDYSMKIWADWDKNEIFDVEKMQ